MSPLAGTGSMTTCSFGLPSAITNTISYVSEILSACLRMGLLTEERMQPPRPFSVAPRRILCEQLPASQLKYGEISLSASTTIYAEGRSPTDGPFQSLRDAAQARVGNINAFFSFVQESMYRKGCLLPAEADSRARSTRSLSVWHSTSTSS